MLRSHLLTRSALLLAVSATALSAQTTQLLPAHADLAEGQHGIGLPFGVPGFRTQILISGPAVGANGAVLTGLRFRADRTSTPLAATVVPNVTVTVSHTSNFVGNMNGQFALNVTGPVTTVFQGAVTLPAHADGFAGPLPWDIAIPFAQPFAFTTAQGNLLVDIVGNNPANGIPVYWLDAVQAGGSATPYGRAGDNPSFDSLNLVVSTGNSLEPRLLSPGHVIDYTSTLSFTSPPGVLALGLVGLPVPIDLGLLGAPTHSLYMAPLVLATHSWTQSFIGWYSTTSLAVPNNPLLIGERIFAQSALFDPAANALGLLTSHAVETRLGDQAEILPMQQLDAPDAAATVGTFVDFGFAQPDHGGTPILLEGVFF